MKLAVSTKNRFFLAGIIILLTDMVTSMIIYLSAARTTGIDDSLDKANSKMYLHDLELYGGKANLLAAGFMSWFAGLWQGEALAYTIAFISVVISLLIFFIAYNVHDQDPANGNEDNHGGTG